MYNSNNAMGEYLWVLMMPNVLLPVKVSYIIINISSQWQRTSIFIWNNSVFSAPESWILLFWCL